MATSTKRGRDNAHHFLLVLANHQPIVAALRYVDREVCPFVSDNAASFRIGEMTVRPGQTRGFRVVSPSSIDRTQTVVSVDSIELLGPHAPGPRPSTDRSIPDAGPDCGDTVFWAPLAECKPAHGLLSDDLSQLLGRFYGELDRLFLPRAETHIRREWKTVELPPVVQVVPDLNQYLAPKSALVVQFDCAKPRYAATWRSSTTTRNR